MSRFSRVQKYPKDPIFGIMESFRQDEREDKVNLGIGTYRDCAGKPHVFSAVRKAELRLVEKELDKEYLPIGGDFSFLDLSLHLLFGLERGDALWQRIAAVQTIGGTGALRLGAELLFQAKLSRLVSIPKPSWPNHPPIFLQSGLLVESPPYLDETGEEIAFDTLIAHLESLPPHTSVVLQACCHNPTGKGFTFEQWNTLCELIQERELLPFFDLAYQGFGKGLAQDITPIRFFLQHQIPLLVAYSFSKNMGLYGERCGFLSVVTSSEKEKRCVQSHLNQLIRPLYSNPPLHGERIVQEILSTPPLRQVWEKELSSLRRRIDETRDAFASLLQRERLLQGEGMFGPTRLKPHQIEWLRQEKAIYLPLSGRVNLAGLNKTNLEFVTQSIQEAEKR